MDILIPCFNEEKRLDGDEIVRHARLFDSYLFVDDGSTDQTPAILHRLTGQIQDRGGKARVYYCERNVGKGEAIRAGVQSYMRQDGLSGKLALTDADLSTPLEEMYRLGSVLDSISCDIIQGSRVALAGRCIVRSAVRHYVGRVGATMISELLGLPMYDTQAGAKVLAGTALRAGLFEEPFLSRWLFDPELFLRAQRAGLSVIEEPLQEWRDVPLSKVGPGSYLRCVVDVLRIRRRYLRKTTAP